MFSLLPPYFDRDAFMHHALHLLDPLSTILSIGTAVTPTYIFSQTVSSENSPWNDLWWIVLSLGIEDSLPSNSKENAIHHSSYIICKVSIMIIAGIMFTCRKILWTPWML